MIEYKLQIVELIARIFAGILFLFSGYDKLFNIKMPGVIAVFKADSDRNNIPEPLLNVVVYYTSVVEFIGGLFLIIGFCTTYTLYALGLDLLLISLAFSIVKPIWDMKHVFPRFILVISLLLVPAEYRMFSLDNFLNLKCV